MRILVTGGTGLVGTRLLPRLVEAGIECRALVRSEKPVPSGVTAVGGDILGPPLPVSALKGIDAVVHLAAVLRSPEPDLIWAVNVEGTRNLIAAVKDHVPDARFIMASTGLVYNKDSLRPSLESDDVSPQRDYPASKIAAEKLLRESGLNWSILRFAYVYGDGDGHLGQIPRVAQLLKLHSANRLSMIHHRDVASFVKMALSGTLDGKIVNTVDEAPMTILELCNMIGAPMEPSAAPLTDPWSGVMDGTLAQSLGFKAEVATTWQAVREGAV
ncbi:NAD(P)-dependent oxidoreductase (plasmid) [Ensifer adhaerens]|uniref:NAD-dependent epimerase/dehydratase family protein n=1 Tax=Ensifer adhaerens TaxID=106592 RepID=UPI0021018452|nr:NAD(P)-dependent oxidoreductase [Ensifer adhaerens]UTV41797.1 NAD(P)-dependent oxidoreductase [Ensifer adhaerens]